jgi:hypothetical protein
LTARQPAKSLFSKCCDDFITTSLPQNGKTEQNFYGCQRTQSNHGTVTKKGESRTAGVFHPRGG